MAYAQAAQSIRPPAIRLSYGVANLIALKATTGRTVPSKFPDPHTGAMEQVAFDLHDGSPLYLSFEDASSLEHQLLDLGIRPGDDFRLTKLKAARGGGSCVRVDRASDPQPSRGSRPEPPVRREEPRREYRPAVAQSESEIEAKLAQSVALARRDPETAREAFRESLSPAAPAVATPPASSPVALSLMLRGLIEQVHAGQLYAASLGLHLSAEDMRALAVTCFIQESRR